MDEESPGADDAASRKSSRLSRYFGSGPSNDDVADEVAEAFVGELPTEVKQIKSRGLRWVFRVVVYGLALAATVFFFHSVYNQKMNATFLSGDSTAGDCERELDSLTGTFRLDTGGKWDTDPAYEPARSLFVVKFNNVPASEYKAAMASLHDQFASVKASSLLNALLTAATFEAKYDDGRVTASFDVESSRLLDLPSKTAGFAGCPTVFGNSDAAFAYDTGVADGDLFFSVDRAAADRECFRTRSGSNLAHVLGRPNPIAYRGQRTVELAIHFHSIIAATAVNYGLVEPGGFMDELDETTFHTTYDDDSDGYDDYSYSYDDGDEPDFAGFLSAAMPPAAGGAAAIDEKDWPAEVDAACVDLPESSASKTDKYYTDKRYPGMQPIVCAKDSAGADVCSVVWAAGLTVFPAIKMWDDECNTCDPGHSPGEACANTFNDQGLDFLGALIVGPGTFRERPALATDADPANKPSRGAGVVAPWDVVQTVGYWLAGGVSFDDDGNDFEPLSTLAACGLHWAPQLIGFNFYNDFRAETTLNTRQYDMRPDEWHCSKNWTHAAVFAKVGKLSSAPMAVELGYYKCTPDETRVVEEALGIAVGGGEFVFIIASLVFVHLLIRQLDKHRLIAFRNGRLVPQDAIDEWSEQTAVDSVARSNIADDMAKFGRSTSGYTVRDDDA